MLITIVAVILISIIPKMFSLFQEGNPIPILKGITALNKKVDIVEISKEPKTYITKTDKGSSPITKLMEREGWKFEEQLGAGYIFSKDDNKLIITSTEYTGKYMIWNLE